MSSMLVVLRGGPFDGREMTIWDWPAAQMVEEMPRDPHREERVRARYLASSTDMSGGEPREMVWDGAHRVGGIHHGRGG